MKVRNGFVSNSSSSSFIVAFEAIPASKQILQKMLYSDKKRVEMYDYTFSSEELADVVWNDFKESRKNPLIKDRIVAELLYGGFEYNEIPAPTYPRSWLDDEHKKYEKECEKYANTVAGHFIDKNSNALFLSFSYADEDGEMGCVLEHGDTFQNFPHIKISHH